MEELMYGSTHTHFEDWFDTANDFKMMLTKFNEVGCKKIAMTGHGNMFAYEDVKQTLAGLKESGKVSEDLNVVPGVEIYFTDKSKHMILIAKNYEGYQDLCRVITDSSKNSKASKGGNDDNEYLTPIVTLENLKKNIRKGNVFATSACVGGVFCYDLGLTEYNMVQRLKKEEKKLEKVLKDREEYIKVIEEFEKKINDPANKKPTKKEMNDALKSGDTDKVEELNKRVDRANDFVIWKQANRPAYNDAKKKLEQANNKLIKFEELKNNLKAYQDTADERWNAAKEDYKQFEEIFGKENFFFEIQNHHLEMEEIAFNNVIKFAYDVDNPNFIASNDIHIGDRKGSDTWKTSVLKRKYERFNRFKQIEESKGDEEEYGIKTDEELKSELLNSIKDFTDNNGVIHTKEEITNNAIGNIKNTLSKCEVIFPEISIDGINHYPKFCDDEKKMFHEECLKGFERRFRGGAPEGYMERLEYEMGIIESMGYAGYHLIVKDYLEYGRLLGYLTDEKQINEAPLSIEELNKYIDDNNIERIGMGIGPGRGSAAGSLACYCLGITDLDPIEHNLMFERFLNPARQSMPDIDSDFKDDIRERTYEYIKAKYGDECVSKIVTKAYTYGKKSVKNAQAYMLTEEENRIKAESHYDELDKNDPKKKQVKEQIEALKKDLLIKNSNLSKMIDRKIKEKDLNKTHPEDGTKAIEYILEEDNDKLDETEKKLLERAVQISGIPSSLSIHACGCIISGDPLSDVIPLAWNDKNKKMTTECLYPQAENLGLLKMDLLNLKNLGVITKVMQNTKDNALNDSVLLRKILSDDFDDTKDKNGESDKDYFNVYKEIYAKGLTQGIFQVESDGMTKMMKDFSPTCFDDIVLLVAAYRPGPLQYIPEIIATKRYLEDPENNPKPHKTITIENEKLDAILKSTYGVPIYQEQVMKIFQDLAGYSLSEADNVRRFMSKKKMEPLALERPKFIEGCKKNGIDEKDADHFFDQLMDFSKYGFNKSHAACYALVSVMTAYLKKVHKAEFYRSAMSNEFMDGNNSAEDVINKYMPEMNGWLNSKGKPCINILPPKIGKSQADICIERSDTLNLRLGYGNIKGESYNDYNPADSIMEFIIQNPTVGRATIDTFIKLNMFNCIYNSPNGNRDEIKRCNHNITKMLEWNEQNFDLVKRYAGLFNEINDLKEKIAEEEECLKISSVDDPVALEAYDESKKNIEEYKNILSEYVSEQNNIKDTLDKKKLEDIYREQFPPMTSAETSTYHKFEKSVLGFNFSVIGQLNKYQNKTDGKNRFFDFSYLKYGGNNDPSVERRVENIPAIIITSDQVISKKGNIFYKLTMIDMNDNILNVTSFSEPKSEKVLCTMDYKDSEDFGEQYTLVYSKPLENIEKPDLNKLREQAKENLKEELEAER